MRPQPAHASQRSNQSQNKSSWKKCMQRSLGHYTSFRTKNITACSEGFSYSPVLDAKLDTKKSLDKGNRFNKKNTITCPYPRLYFCYDSQQPTDAPTRFFTRLARVPCHGVTQGRAKLNPCPWRSIRLIGVSWVCHGCLMDVDYYCRCVLQLSVPL